MANTTSLKHRPIYQALSGGVESIAIALGPLVGGAVARASSWRASFYVVVPVGIACIAAVVLFVHGVERPERAHLPWREKMDGLDLPGFVLYVPAMTCLILGLQFAGSEYSWDSWRIILLLALAGTLSAAFLVREYVAGEEAMFPLRMLSQKTVLFSCGYTFCNSAALFVMSYYVCIPLCTLFDVC